MAITLKRSREFERSSPVTRYWVANCTGFAVVGGAEGVVEDVISDGDPHVPEALVVRCGRRRTRMLPASAVASVVPAERLIVVDHVPRPVATHASDAVGVAGRGIRIGARTGVRAGGALCSLGWALTRRGWKVGAPVAALLLRRCGSESARLVRSVPWREFGRSARSATTSLWQALSSAWSRLRTTSSRRSDEQRS